MPKEKPSALLPTPKKEVPTFLQSVATEPYKAPDRALKEKIKKLEKYEQETGIKRDGRLCIYKRNGKFCGKWAIAGSTVCSKHGGAAPQVKKAAQARLNELLLRKVERLDEISEQSTHMPSALGATQAIINRVMGKVGDAPKKENNGPTIQIGISLAGGGKPQVTALQLPSPTVITNDVIDAETDEDDA